MVISSDPVMISNRIRSQDDNTVCLQCEIGFSVALYGRGGDFSVGKSGFSLPNMEHLCSPQK